MLLLDLLDALDDAGVVLTLTGPTFTAEGPTAALDVLSDDIAATATSCTPTSSESSPATSWRSARSAKPRR